MILSGIIISGRDNGGGACRGKDNGDWLRQPLRVCVLMHSNSSILRVRNVRTACHCRGKDRRGGGAVPKEWSGSGTPDSLFFGWFGF